LAEEAIVHAGAIDGWDVPGPLKMRVRRCRVLDDKRTFEVPFAEQYAQQ